jgi:phosphoglucosamine mutase
VRDSFGLVISASHNDFLDNGIKIFMPNGEKLSKDIEKRIEKIIAGEMNIVDSSSIGKAERFDESGARYIEFCKSTVPTYLNFSSLRIVLDCAHGACYKVSPSVFKELGAEVILIGNNPDGFNINQGCGSTHPELLQEEVVKHRADYGVALDGDGDRVILVDSHGNILDGDDLLYIMAFANPNRVGAWAGIVGTKMSNFGLEDGLKKLGYKFLRADVGDKYVSQKLSEKGWLLGGETSGHIISKDLVSTGDGTIAALKVISSLMILEKTPSEVLANYNKRPQINIAISVKNKDVINDSSIQSAISDAQSDITVDRVLVRPSGTESKIRVMVEASDENTAKKYAKDLSQLIESKL